MKTTFVLALLVLPGFARSQVDLRPNYNIGFTAGDAVDWFGEPLLLFWTAPPLLSNGQRDQQTLIEFFPTWNNPYPRVTFEVVGWAGYDPRPCAVGTTVRLTSMDYLGDYPWACSPVLETTIGPDGFGYHFPTTKVTLDHCISGGGIQMVESQSYLATYCFRDHINSPYTWTFRCDSNCFAGDPYPVMSFLLVRPRIR